MRIEPHTLEMRNPVVGRLAIALLIILRRLPDIPVTVLVILGAARLFEPFMLIASVVDDQIHEEFHTALVAPGNQLLDIFNCAILIGDAVVVGNIIAHVHLRGFVRWTQPNDIDGEVLDVVQLGDDTGDIANTIVI